jgi:hypothetical protein
MMPATDLSYGGAGDDARVIPQFSEASLTPDRQALGKIQLVHNARPVYQGIHHQHLKVDNKNGTWYSKVQCCFHQLITHKSVQEKE